MPYVYFDCSWRRPCPICRRCMNYAPHRYARCRSCIEGLRPCKHSDEIRVKIIKRRNFRLALPQAVKDELDRALKQGGGLQDGQA